MTAENDPDIGDLLAITNEELKGKLKPAENYVDKQTLVDATRVQNNVLLLIHEKLTRLEHEIDGVRIHMSKRIDGVESELQKWCGRVENLEKKTERQEHSMASIRQEIIDLEVNEFNHETRDALRETREDIDGLVETVKELPNTISITTSQVFSVDGDSHQCLDDIIHQQQETSFALEESLRQHDERMDEMDNHSNNEMNRVMEWVTNQKKNEVDDLNFLKEAVEKLEFDLNGKMSYDEVEDKIALKVRELVNQIKEALLAVEEDEADFKNVANALHELFNSLKESKADRSEMAQLRNQIISSQLNLHEGSIEGSLDYKGLRKILSSYCKTEMVDRKLDGKASKDLTSQRLDHTENMIDKILGTIDELWFLMKRKTEQSTQPTLSRNETTFVSERENVGRQTQCPEAHQKMTEDSSLSTPDSSFAPLRLGGSNNLKEGHQKTHRRASESLKHKAQTNHDFGRRRPNNSPGSRRPKTAPGNPLYYSTSMSKNDRNMFAPSYQRDFMTQSHAKIRNNSKAHLPAIESKHLVRDRNGKFVVNNRILREPNELKIRKIGPSEVKAMKF